MKVLVIEDDPEIAESIAFTLRIRWPEVQLISTHLGEKGAELVEAEAPDVVILDLGLPDMGGFEVLKEIRGFSSVPIIILTVSADETDIVRGLEWGADDYMVKPFRQLELLARLKAAVRRQLPSGDESSLAYGPLRFNPTTRQLFYGDKEVKLTGTESQIFHYLIKNAGHVVPHSHVAEAVWGPDYVDASDSLKVHVRHLREKLEVDPNNPQFILTKAGVGYLLVKPEGS